MSSERLDWIIYRNGLDRWPPQKTAANQENAKKSVESRAKQKKYPFLIIMSLVNFAGDMFGPVLDFL